MITKKKKKVQEKETDVSIYVKTISEDPSNSIEDLEIREMNGYVPSDGEDYAGADMFQWYNIQTPAQRERLHMAYPWIRKFQVPDKVCVIRSSNWPANIAYVSTMKKCMEYGKRLIDSYFN